MLLIQEKFVHLLGTKFERQQSTQSNKENNSTEYGIDTSLAFKG